MSTPLEEERRALLERMRASRENYRSRFPDEPSSQAHYKPHHQHLHDPSPPNDHAFPRSHTFRLITRHPYVTALAASALIAAIPGGAVKKAVKGSAVFAAGMIGSQARILMARELLPSMIRLIRSRKQ
jgi:hypothetical protein